MVQGLSLTFTIKSNILLKLVNLIYDKVHYSLRAFPMLSQGQRQND